MNIFEILIVQPIFNLLIGLYSLIPGGDFGISLIIFTVLVRFAMYPLVKKQLHQTRQMRKLQPQLAKIKKETKGNKQLESMRMLELYKEHGVSPFRAFGILLIQLPIFIALFIVIRVFTEHRDEIAKWTYDFMENLAPIKQLIENPESFNHMFLGFIDLTKSAFADGGVNIALILIALIAAGTQYFMSKQTMPHSDNKKRLRDVMSEAAQGKQADQSEMNSIVMRKMMKLLPVIMFFVMINVPGALALYYAMSNIVAVAQQAYLLRKDEDEMDKLADKPVKDKKATAPAKKATAKAREKAAKEANVTKISAKDDTKKKGKK
jgi:YidC/Oxa1 family membrane protein insertase